MSDITSPVKKAIDAQSGRFEFFKQALTLSLAGVAGTAALFTDITKIPSGLPSKIAVVVFGVFLLLTVVFSVMGISTYANLLNALDTGEDAKQFQKSIITHAKMIFVVLGLAVLALVAFAWFRLFLASEPLSPDAAMELARRTISIAAGTQNQPIQLDHFEVDKRNFIIVYAVGPNSLKYVLRINEDTGQVEIISQEKQAAPAELKKP